MSDGSDSGFPARMAKPAERALVNAGITSLEQLANYSESNIAKLHGMGPKALGQLNAALQERGLSFADGADATR